MNAATLPAAHTFTPAPDDRRRCTCGKSRNVKAHGYTPTRGAGRAAAEKLNDAQARQEQAADTAQAAEDAVAAVYARFAANKAETDAELLARIEADVETEAEMDVTRPQEEQDTQPADEAAAAIAAAAAEIEAIAAANAAKPAKAPKAPKEAAAGHRIAWFVYLDGARVRYSTNMGGDLPAWDLTCSCGWDTKTGGATKGAVRKMMAAHKATPSA